jgi:phage shock protein C
MTGRLYRSRTDKMLGGVCGGLGRYLGIDSTLLRLFFVLLALGRGVGVFVYLAMWLILPREGQAEGASIEEAVRASADEIAGRARAFGDEVREATRTPHPQAGALIGAVLVVLGVVFLLQALHIAWLWWLSLEVLWPLLMILAGAFVLLRHVRGG